MDWFSEHLAAVWLGLAILLGIAEMASLDLIFLMLAFGALAGLVTALAGAEFPVQALVAAGASVATLALVRPGLIKKLHTGPDLTMGHARLVGQRATVVQRMTGDNVGQVRVAGELWSAVPYDDSIIIEPGATVEVFEIRGATVYVHPLPTLEA